MLPGPKKRKCTEKVSRLAQHELDRLVKKIRGLNYTVGSKWELRVGPKQHLGRDGLKSTSFYDVFSWAWPILLWPTTWALADQNQVNEVFFMRHVSATSASYDVLDPTWQCPTWHGIRGYDEKQTSLYLMTLYRNVISL